jgi:phosphoglycerate kinase
VVRKRTVEGIDVAGKRVLLRVDFNVPLDSSGAVADDGRIKACIPTIRYLIDRDARTVICSHLGRPDGEVVEGLRLAPVAERLSQLLGRPVTALRQSVGAEVEATVASLRGGEVVLLENIRFHPEEEANDPGLAEALSRLADVFVNDAFGASHRAHASVVGVANHLPAVAGLLMEKEIDVLSGALESPARPFAAVIGGAKISGKLAVLENIAGKVDVLLLGGGMAATFLKSLGHAVGASVVEHDRLEHARRLLGKAGTRGARILVPQDVVVAERLEAGAGTSIVSVSEIPDGRAIVDIGPATIEQFSDELQKCRTVLWNGPMGVFEIPEFANGTRAMMEVLAHLRATTVIGGGSTAEAATEMGLADRMSHVSTGGGASLEFLEGKTLPGVAVLQDRH